MPITAFQIAEQVRGEVIGDGSVELTGLAPADCARAGDLTFAEKESYFAAAEQSQAAAILVSGEFASRSGKFSSAFLKSARGGGEAVTGIFSAGPIRGRHSSQRNHCSLGAN